METTTSGVTARHAWIRLSTTAAIEFVDLTERVQALVADAGVHLGFVSIQSLHTTTAVLVNEHEPMLLTDIASLLERLAPIDAGYMHDEALERTGHVIAGERLNGHAHCRAALLGSTVVLNIVNGRLQLGTWQRVLFLELDGPRARELSLIVLGGSRP